MNVLTIGLVWSIARKSLDRQTHYYRCIYIWHTPSFILNNRKPLGLAEMQLLASTRLYVCLNPKGFLLFRIKGGVCQIYIYTSIINTVINRSCTSNFYFNKKYRD